jgi:hypothetical protein
MGHAEEDIIDGLLAARAAVGKEAPIYALAMRMLPDEREDIDFGEEE